MFCSSNHSHIRKRRNCGYHGPRPGTPSLPAQPKSSKEIKPKSLSAREHPTNPLPGCSGTSYPGCLFTWAILLPGTPKELGPKDSRPRNARPILRPGTSYPRCLFTQVFPPPVGDSTKRSCRPVHHDISISSPINRPPRIGKHS